eukprot:UN02063
MNAGRTPLTSTEKELFLNSESMSRNNNNVGPSNERSALVGIEMKEYHSPRSRPMSFDQNSWCGCIDRYFELSARRSNITCEIRAGLVTFLTMSYIIIVNPPIMALAGLKYNTCFSATCIASGFSTILVGLFANLPVGCAPGIGLSAYYTYGLVTENTVSPQMGLGAALIAGVLNILLTSFGVANLILTNIPEYIKQSTVAGMGLLIALIGFSSIGTVVPGSHGSLLAMGDVMDWKIWLSLGCLLFMGTLYTKKCKSALLVTILIGSLIYFIFTGNWPREFVATPGFESPLKLVQLYPAPILQCYILGVFSFILVLLF